MDLEENIRIAATEIAEEHRNDDFETLEQATQSIEKFVLKIIKSDFVKDYWYNEFKAEQVNSMLSDIGTSNYSWNEPIIMTGFKEYKEYMRDCSDPSFTFEDWKDMMDKYNQVTRKITDEISDSVFGVAGKQIDIILSEKWYRPDIFDHIDYEQQAKSEGITISVGPGKLCRQESHIIKEHTEKGITIIGISDMPNIGKGLRMDPITFKEMSIGIFEQIKEVPIFDYTVISKEFLGNSIIEDKPWNTKKQKRNNYKKKRRK